MKRIVLMLAFVLATSFGFANTNTAQLNEDDNYPITVHTSCGVTGMIIVQDGDTLADIIDMAMDMEAWLC